MGVLDFFGREAGQRRRAALDEFGRSLEQYVPPGLRPAVGLLAEMTPTAANERAAMASDRLFQPDRTVGQRVGDFGEMASEIAGVVAPVAVAGRAGMPAAEALQEALMGFSAGSQQAGRAVVDRLNQPGPVPTMYSNPLKYFHGGREMIQTPRATIDPEGLLEGFSVTPDRGVAEMYANMRGGNAVTEFTVDPNNLRPIGELDLYDLQNRLESVKGLDEGDLAEADLLAELRALGYNAVKYSEPEFGLRVLDPSILRSSYPSSPAQEVAGLLSSGRAADVTDEMLAKLTPNDEMELFDLYQRGATGMDLPMDEASRMARAREMGFDTDAYHGTGYGGFSEFRGAQTFGATDPADASVYARYGAAGQVYPITMRADNPERFDLLTWDPQRESGVFDRAREAGHDAYYATDGRRIAFNPANIRSRFARFDPRLAHLRNLSAGVGGLGLLGMSYPQEEQY